jgi:hypothetical protein
MATLVELRCEIDARMHQGESFSAIEDDVIQASQLPEEHKSALWLYGWSFVSPEAQRREADAHIAQLAAADTPRKQRQPALAAARARPVRLSIVRS